MISKVTKKSLFYFKSASLTRKKSQVQIL